jgi:predicted nucleic acid-binding protein
MSILSWNALTNEVLSIGLQGKAREVSSKLETIIPATLPVTLADIHPARQLVERHPMLNTRDLIHAAVMLENGLTCILSTDCHFDQLTEIERMDPRDFRRGT